MRKLLYILFALLLGLGPAGALAGPPRPKRAARISPLSDSLRKTARTPDAAARSAFSKFVAKTGDAQWRVRYSPTTALPEALVGGRTARYPGGPEAAAMAFLAENRELLKVDPAQLKLAFSKSFLGTTHLQYSQIHNSVPVEFSYVRVHVTPDGEVTGCQSKFVPEINVPLTPGISPEHAAAAASADAGFGAKPSKPELVLYPDPEAAGALKLAWKLKVRGTGASSGVWIYFVDAANAQVLFRYDDLRYACADPTKANGTVTGSVYAVSPLASGDNAVDTYAWAQPVSMPIANQYVWTRSHADPKVITSNTGEYCGTQAGKVFASLKGPYFAVTNFRGQSAHFDNGSGAWSSVATSKQSPHPYNDSQTYPAYAVTVPDTLIPAGKSLAKVMPHFSASLASPFEIGFMDIWGTISDMDELTIKDAAGNTVGAYTGKRTVSFYGPSVESAEYSLNLKTDDTGTHNGFSVDSSRYLLLTDPNTGTGANIVWATNTVNGSGLFYMDNSMGLENTLDEVNVFYHLNKMHDYFGTMNKDPNHSGAAATDLSAQVPVMVHAHGEADTICAPGSTAGGNCVGGMVNAFYNSDTGNLIFGDGPMDPYGNYRSFALDGTIIRHEYAHLVSERIYPMINFGEFGAISEAVADYFSLSSFRAEGFSGNTLANFVGSGEGVARDLAGSTRTMPTNWVGEVHDDGQILSQALWQLKNSTPTTSTDLGNFSSWHAYFPGMPKADVITYAAMFYFPDNFANFYDAMMEACKYFSGTDCTKITTVFDNHGIPGYSTTADGFDSTTTASGLWPDTLCRNNNGPECATDISTMTRLTATISPAGDLDYYSLPLPAGNLTVRLDLPASNQYLYQAYGVYLFNNLRDHVTDYAPVIYGGGGCPDVGNCYTEEPNLTFSYDIPASGRYYLVVAGAMNQYGGNSATSDSQHPYTLNLSYTPKGSAIASLTTASYDNDLISFTVPYLKTDMSYFPSSATTVATADVPPAAEMMFEYAQLRDHNYIPIAHARTNLASGSYLGLETGSIEYVMDDTPRDVMKGKVRVKPGFSSRYPGIGTVYLEIYGRNHLGKVVSMGVSNAINLATNKTAAVAYNNIITGICTPTVNCPTIKYDVQSPGTLSIKIYTAAGTLVKTVYNGPVTAGKGSKDWDGTNSKGSYAASGIYFVKISGAGINTVDKIAVVR